MASTIIKFLHFFLKKIIQFHFFIDSHIAKISKNHPKTRKKRIVIRRLVRPEKTPTQKSRTYLKIFGFAATVFCLIGVLWKNVQFREELKHLSMNQYQLYLHGRENYCDEPFEHWHIANVLHHQIIGQEAALDAIDLALRRHENTTAIALIGTQGVGKTSTLNLIKQNFQWHLNIQQYIWSLIESPENQLKRLLKMIDGLTTCGQNGIFVDSVPLKRADIIDKFHQQLLAYSNANRIKVIIFYVFQTNTVIEANDLQQMDNIEWIHFRQFNLDDVRNCINMESDRLSISITPEQIDELLTTVDVKRFGCKHIAAKIARQEA